MSQRRNGRRARGASCPAGPRDDELLARISRDVARQLAELAPRPRWRDEAEYWAVLLMFALALCGVLWLLLGKP